MVGEEVLEGRPFFHRHALPGEGVILLQGRAGTLWITGTLQRAPKIVAGQGCGQRLSILIVRRDQCGRAGSIPIVREVPFRRIVPGCCAITTGKLGDARDTVLGVVGLKVRDPQFRPAGHIPVGIILITVH